MTSAPNIARFVNIGERTNVTGSARFRKLIMAGDYDAAVEVARQQVENGAQIIDVNMDEALLDAEAAMATFLKRIAAEPDIARVPVMIDSSRFSVIETGLKHVTGKAIVNSLSLKEGEAEFLRQAHIVRRYGAAAVVMAFDEKGQADTVERRLTILARAYQLLTGIGFPPQDIIFDPNVFAVATGMPEHDRYALDFIETVKILKERFPLAKISGGISNLSFSFRGNNTVREAMHAVFLYHAIRAGLDMGIVNAGQLVVYDEIPAALRERVEDVILCRRPDAAERLLEIAERYRNESGTSRTKAEDDRWRDAPVAERIATALIKGIDRHITDDVAEALEEIGSPLAVIEGPLMAGMNRVGDLFGAGKMFLPQVVKAARVMKKAVAWLTPHLEAEKKAAADSRPKGKVLLATVKGDVHDIGKNIVGVVLGCNNFEVIDLGVMVPPEKIIATARAEQVDIIGLSGLITPSLDEMVTVARMMEREGLRLPLLIGGATTSKAHTALKIDPCYSGPVIHVLDAGRAAAVVQTLLSDELRDGFVSETKEAYAKLRAARAEHPRAERLIPLPAARANRVRIDWAAYAPPRPRALGVKVLRNYPLSDLVDRIDWTPFFRSWELAGNYPAILEDETVGEAARTLFRDAQAMLERILRESWFTAHGVIGFWPANADGDDILLYADEDRREVLARISFLRQQMAKRADRPNFCLADFVAPVDSGKADYLGLFAVTAGHGVEERARAFEAGGDDYSAVLVKALGDRLAEAFAERLHERVRKEFWGYAPDENLTNEDLIKERYRGIRPAPGYPACPDHSAKEMIFRLLDAPLNAGMTLSENLAMLPPSSVSGFYFAHPEARYFGVGKIGRDQLEDYARRMGLDLAEAARRLRPNLADDPFFDADTRPSAA